MSCHILELVWGLLQASQVPCYQLEELLQYISDRRDAVMGDVWNDANLGEAFLYLLQKKSKFSLATERLVAMVPAEDVDFVSH